MAGFGVLVVAGLAALVALTGSSDEDLVIYTARLHYGEEEVFRRFADDRGYDLKLFGGTGSALVERLKAEGEDTEADLLITVDGANLQQALAEDLLQPTASAAVESSVPEKLRDPEGRWTALTTRARTVMRSTERVPEDDGACDVRRARRSPLQGPALPAHQRQRLQLLVRRRSDREGGPRCDGGDAARLDGERPDDPRLGRGRARGDRGGPL